MYEAAGGGKLMQFTADFSLVRESNNGKHGTAKLDAEWPLLLTGIRRR